MHDIDRATGYYGIKSASRLTPYSRLKCKLHNSFSTIQHLVRRRSHRAVDVL